jgi:hypothetical protein
VTGLDRHEQPGREVHGDTKYFTPGLLKVRLLGAEADCAAAADQLAAWTLERSAPRANRREPGVRVYLTLLIGGPAAAPGSGP